jgi:PPP family 3-phenylpropionic acid transporter
MTSPSRGLELRLSALHAASFVGIGVYLPFFPVWLESKDLSATMIGVIIALPIIVRILAVAPLLALTDRKLGRRQLLIASHLGQLVGFPVLMAVDDGAMIAVLVGLIAVFQAAVMPGNDLVTANAVGRNPGLHYGRIRGFGSIAFLASSVAAGYLVAAVGADVILWLLALTPVLAILATQLALPTGDAEGNVPAAAPLVRPERVPKVVWIPMAAAALTQASHGGIYAFGSIHWRSIGFSDPIIGYLWAIGVVAEIAVFYLLGRTVGRGAGLGLLLVGSGAATVRFAALALDPGLPTTFVLQALHGFSFGASHLGAMACLAALVPEQHRGRAQGLLGSLVAFGMAAATVASGFVYRAAGPAAFAAMAPLGAIGFALTLAAMRSLKARSTADRRASE